MRPKFQKQSALKLAGRIIPLSGGNTQELAVESVSKACFGVHARDYGLKPCIFVEVDDLLLSGRSTHRKHLQVEVLCFVIEVRITTSNLQRCPMLRAGTCGCINRTGYGSGALMLKAVRLRRRGLQYDKVNCFFKRLFSKLEIIFCVFLAENNFVNALIPFIGVRRWDNNPSPLRVVRAVLRLPTIG
jgi:hypothetical protein